MDNVTHSLIGLAAGEAVATARKKDRVPIWIASLLANNIPDIDVPLGALLTSDALSRLTHHRGHTHTLLLGPLQGLIVFVLVWALYRRRANFPLRETLAVSLLGPVLHLWADSWNSYGVHPFWPFSNEWYYGDFVFILEPWIWMIFFPALFFATGSKILRSCFAIFGGGILIAAWLNDLVPPLIAGMLSVFAVGFLLALRRLAGSGRRIAVAIGCFAVVLSLFALTSRRLQARYARPGFELALSPYPGNPFCWQAHSAGFAGEDYRAAVMRLAPWPEIYPVGKCPLFFSGSTSAPLNRVDQPPSDEILTLGIFSARRADFEKISQDCRAAEFLRFARIPYWKPSGEGWFVGDLRFDRGGGQGSFATVTIPGSVCPAWPTPWLGRFHPDRYR